MTVDKLGAGAAPLLRAHMLGSTRLLVGDRPIPDTAWPRRAARSLLLLLLATPSHRLPRDQVLDILWPDASPESAERSLRKVVHTVRRILEPELTSGRNSAYLTVCTDAVGMTDARLWVDVDAFETELASARSGPQDELRSRLRHAVTLYGGDLLADDPYSDWIVAPRERLHRLHRRAVLDLARMDLQAGEPALTIPGLETLWERDAADEVAMRALMRALAATGRRDDALHWFGQAERWLRTELDVDPDAETIELAEEIRALAPASPSPVPSIIAIRPHARIPAPPNRLIGRVRELERLQDLLLSPDIRLVTLTGPGGVGKTRLAQEAARQVSDDIGGETCFVSLATIQDTESVMPTVAHALGLPEGGAFAAGEAIAATLRDRELLLVLDNLEQVVDVSPQIASLLERCEHLTVLATSREPLQLRAEHEVPLSPLSVPRTVQSGRSRTLVRFESIELFLHRAHAVRPGFVLTDDNATTVAAICQHLDGLPLAIELAAAQVRVLSPDELLEGLTNRFALLAGGYRDLPGRQQSLRDAITWSYDLLSPSLRRLFRHLAVFAGSFSLDAVEAVVAELGMSCCGDPVARQLDALVLRSLLTRAEGDGTRYLMLESIRAYGLDILTPGEADEARRAHAHQFLALAEKASGELNVADDATCLDRIEADLDNFRAALTWALEQHTSDIALRTGSALRRFWFLRGYLREGRDWIEQALAQDAIVPPAIRVQALFAAGELSFFLSDLDQAKRCAEEGLDVCRSLGDIRGMADALLGLGHVARLRGDLPQAAAHLHEAIELSSGTGDQRSLARLHEALGTVYDDQDDLEQAERLYTASMHAYREAGNARGVAANLTHRARIARKRGDTATAIALVEESLSTVRRLRDAYAMSSITVQLGELLAATGDYAGAADALRESLVESRDHQLDAHTASVLRALTSLAAAVGDAVEAATLSGAIETFCQVKGVELPGAGNDLVVNGEAVARAMLGDEPFASARERGRAMTPEQAIAEALAVYSRKHVPSAVTAANHR